MSWDRDIMNIACPCGKGMVQWVHEEDDWNRQRDTGFKILCADCSKAYCIQMFSHCDGKETWDSFYCVPTSVNQISAPSFPQYNDFKHYLIFNYTYNDLFRMSSLLEVYTSYTSIPKSEDSLRKVVYYCGKYDGTKRLSYVRDVLLSAIKDYSSEDMNYDEYLIKQKEYSDNRAVVLRKSFKIV